MALIHFDFEIDSDVHPELHAALLRIENPGSRGERLRQLAASGLVWEAVRIHGSAVVDRLPTQPVEVPTGPSVTGRRAVAGAEWDMPEPLPVRREPPPALAASASPAHAPYRSGPSAAPRPASPHGAANAVASDFIDLAIDAPPQGPVLADSEPERPGGIGTGGVAVGEGEGGEARPTAAVAAPVPADAAADDLAPAGAPAPAPAPAPAALPSTARSAAVSGIQPVPVDLNPPRSPLAHTQTDADVGLGAMARIDGGSNTSASAGAGAGAGASAGADADGGAEAFVVVGMGVGADLAAGVGADVASDSRGAARARDLPVLVDVVEWAPQDMGVLPAAYGERLAPPVAPAPHRPASLSRLRRMNDKGLFKNG